MRKVTTFFLMFILVFPFLFSLDLCACTPLLSFAISSSLFICPLISFNLMLVKSSQRNDYINILFSNYLFCYRLLSNSLCQMSVPWKWMMMLLLSQLALMLNILLLLSWIVLWRLVILSLRVHNLWFPKTETKL